MGLIYSNIPELEGSNTEIVLSNLYELEGDIETVVEKRLAHLSELASAISRDGDDPDVIKSILLSIKSEGNADSGNIIEENRPAADAVFFRMSLVERLNLFREVLGSGHVSKSGIVRYISPETDIVVADDAAERIAYIKNSYNDVAYMQFSSLLSSPRAAYFTSVSDVCESVYNESCEYCILPVETSSDGKLLSFYEMILKYSLKITAVYDMRGESGYTRYALIGKRSVFNNASVRSKARNRYFEFILTEADAVSLEALLCAANFCSLKLCRIDTLNVNSSAKRKGAYVCPVFRVDSSDLHTFLMFLAIDCPDYIPVGLYTQI